MSLALVVALSVALAVLLVGAVRRCRREIADERARVRRRAEVADVVGKAGRRWDRGTAAMEREMIPLLDGPPAAGFGDVEVERELLARALRAPDLVEESR